jgi:predicted Zn-dependent protease
VATRARDRDRRCAHGRWTPTRRASLLNNTGNAGGVRTTLDPGAQDFAALLKQMGTGLLVTELIGFGVNTVTGDYSRGAVASGRGRDPLFG